MMLYRQRRRLRDIPIWSWDSASWVIGYLLFCFFRYALSIPDLHRQGLQGFCIYFLLLLTCLGAVRYAINFIRDISKP